MIGSYKVFLKEDMASCIDVAERLDNRMRRELGKVGVVYLLLVARNCYGR